MYEPYDVVRTQLSRRRTTDRSYTGYHGNRRPLPLSFFTHTEPSARRALYDAQGVETMEHEISAYARIATDHQRPSVTSATCKGVVSRATGVLVTATDARRMSR